jgi:hypothetical protein
MKNFTIKLDWQGTITIERDYSRGTCFNTPLAINPDALTDASRKRLTAVFSRTEWKREEKETWYEFGYGYDFDGCYVFSPVAEGGDPSAKHHLLHALWARQANKDESETP